MITVKQAPRVLSPKQLRSDMHLSREKMAHLMSVSAKTIERWEERGTLPMDSPRLARLARVAEIFDLGTKVYTQEGFATFLQTPLPEFGHRTALQEMESGHFDAVFSALASDYEGMGY